MEDIKDLISNKGFLLDYLRKMFDSADNNARGLRAMKERGFSQEGMLEKVIEVTAIQSEQIGKLALVALFVVQAKEDNERGDCFVLRNWGYYGLIDKIGYKAKMYGIEVKKS